MAQTPRPEAALDRVSALPVAGNIDFTVWDSVQGAHHEVVVQKHLEVGVDAQRHDLGVVGGRLPDVLGHALACGPAATIGPPAGIALSC